MLKGTIEEVLSRTNESVKNKEGILDKSVERVKPDYIVPATHF